MTDRNAGWLVAGAAVAWLLALSPADVAHAELLRCKGPDGKMIYTDDRSQCPGAEPFEPSKVIHGTEKQAPAPPSARLQRTAPGAKALDADAGAEQHWRDLRASKQDELRQVAAERDELKGYVTWCNRGGSLVGRDATGIKRPINCDQLRSRMSELETRKAELDEYLESGLADECRRAGCEPGWIR